MWFLVIIFFGWVFWEILKAQSEKKKNNDWKKLYGIDNVPTHPWCELENKPRDSIIGTFEKVEPSSLGGISYYFRLTQEHESYIREKSFGNFKEVKHIWKIGDRVYLWVPDKSRNDVKPTNLIGLMSKVGIGTEVMVEYFGEGDFCFQKKDGTWESITTMTPNIEQFNEKVATKKDFEKFIKTTFNNVKVNSLRINDKTILKKYDVFKIYKQSQVKNKWIKIK